MASGSGGFMLDKQNAKFGGVCAGIADYFGLNVATVRMAVIVGHFVLPFLIGFFWLAYGAAVLLCPVKPPHVVVVTHDTWGNRLRDDAPVDPGPVWQKYRALEQRLARIEEYYTGHNTSLARQIAALTDSDASDARAMQSMIDAARAQAAVANPVRPAFGRAVR